MHHSVGTCMPGDPGNETRRLQIVKTFVQLARREGFRFVIAVRPHDSVLVDNKLVVRVSNV